MKLLIFLGTLLLGGAGGWLLKSNNESNSTPTRVVVAPASTTPSRQSTPQNQQASLSQILSAVQKEKRPLVANGDEMFTSRFHVSTVWIRSVKQDGSLGTKHIFVEAKESPPASGMYIPVRYVFVDRPDLSGRLYENINPGDEGRLIARLQIKSNGSKSPVELWVGVNKNEQQRVITLLEDSFPTTEGELWNLVKQRLLEFRIRTT